MGRGGLPPPAPASPYATSPYAAPPYSASSHGSSPGGRHTPPRAPPPVSAAERSGTPLPFEEENGSRREATPAAASDEVGGKEPLGTRSVNTSDALELLEAKPPAAGPSPGTLIRQVREVTAGVGDGSSSRVTFEPAGGEAGGEAYVEVAGKTGSSGAATAEGGVDPTAEISDIDRRLNQLQEFLRQAKEGFSA